VKFLPLPPIAAEPGARSLEELGKDVAAISETRTTSGWRRFGRRRTLAWRCSTFGDGDLGRYWRRVYNEMAAGGWLAGERWRRRR
jgi:hypothetical protein